MGSEMCIRDSVERAYGDRSIVKEADQLISIIRSKSIDNASIDISIRTSGQGLKKYSFDKNISQNFHKIVSNRSLGKPLIYSGKIVSLDHKNKKGKFLNQANEKQSTILFSNSDDFFKAHPFLGQSEYMTFIGCPFLEYGTYDLSAGDVYFIDLFNGENKK